MEAKFLLPTVILLQSGIYKSVDMVCDTDVNNPSMSIPAQSEPYVVIFMAERIYIQEDNTFAYTGDVMPYYSEIYSYNLTIMEHMISNRQSIGFSEMVFHNNDYRPADITVIWERPPMVQP